MATLTAREEGLAVWRGANVGIISQFFQLLPTLPGDALRYA